MRTNRIGFFKKYFLSIVEQRLFPYILKEGFISAFGFFFKMVLLFSTAFAILATAQLFDEFPKYIKVLDENLPEFTLQNGVIYTSGKTEFELDDNVYVFFGGNSGDVDLAKTYEETKDKYDLYVIAQNDGLDIYTPSISETTIDKLGRFVFSKVNGTDKQVLIGQMKEMADSYMARLIVMLSFIVFFLVLYGIYRIFYLLLYAFSTFVLNIIFVNKLKVLDYFKVAIYVSALPMLLESFAFIVARNLPEIANFINMMIALIYVFYALRAIKLDKILQTAVGKTPEEKIKNAIMHAQEELEKQIEDLEKQKADLDEKKKQKEITEKQEEQPEEKPNEENNNIEENNQENNEDKK